MDDGDARPTYHRVLLKLSGEAFAPASGSGISDASTGLPLSDAKATLTEDLPCEERDSQHMVTHERG